MALEAVVYAQGLFGYGAGRDSPYALAPWCDAVGAGAGGPGDLFADWDVVPNAEDQWEPVSSWDLSEASTESKAAAAGPEPAAAAGRRKRRRTKIVKNKEEVESQRRTHIAVERNRRRQMNDYLAALRSLMPSSYAQRGDQASIVGGAINYVKELEQLLQSLEVQKSVKNRSGSTDDDRSPFASFFTFPQYSTSCNNIDAPTASDGSSASNVVKSETAVADIEVTMVEGHASLKVLAPRRPKQLQKLIAGMQQLRIPPLHLNVTSVDAMVLYSFSLKVEDGSKLSSVEDIAAAVHEILGRIQREGEEEAMGGRLSSSS
ncbi:transcription factor bHLH96-like [Lolium rigidum]|uniref:transcription factor bHLH96-like n=1 Tax=Lolium rigidum TaxID=89674 RepID=UPI001F5E2AC8|nr:transcription factor bHLH96-like [Lolium rigidum]